MHKNEKKKKEKIVGTLVQEATFKINKYVKNDLSLS